MSKQKEIKRLASLIKENSGCIITVDNDGWYIETKKGEPITDSSEWAFPTDFYNGEQDIYGEGIAQVFLYILNEEGFNIKVTSV